MLQPSCNLGPPSTSTWRSPDSKASFVEHWETFVQLSRFEAHRLRSLQLKFLNTDDDRDMELMLSPLTFPLPTLTLDTFGRYGNFWVLVTRPAVAFQYSSIRVLRFAGVYIPFNNAIHRNLGTLELSSLKMMLIQTSDQFLEALERCPGSRDSS